MWIETQMFVIIEERYNEVTLKKHPSDVVHQDWCTGEPDL
jgi:hypothetical protein